MAFYIILIFLMTTFGQKNSVNVSQNFTIAPHAFGQIQLSSISQINSNSSHMIGTLSLSFNLTITNEASTQENIQEQTNPQSTPLNGDGNNQLKFDVVLFHNPQNFYYLCYMSQITQILPLLKECYGFQNMQCSHCSLFATSKIAKDIAQNIKTPFIQGQLQTNYTCYIGCTSLIIPAFIVNMTEIANSAGVIIIDNTDFPFNGTPGNNEISFNSIYSLEVFINTYLSISQVASLETNYKYSWLLLAIFLLMTLLFSIVLCNLCLSYRRIKQQKQQLSDGSTKARSKEKIT